MKYPYNKISKLTDEQFHKPLIRRCDIKRFIKPKGRGLVSLYELLNIIAIDIVNTPYVPEDKKIKNRKYLAQQLSAIAYTIDTVLAGDNKSRGKVYKKTKCKVCELKASRKRMVVEVVSPGILDTDVEDPAQRV